MVYIYGPGQPYIYGPIGREITKYTVIHGVHIYTVLANPTYLLPACGWIFKCVCLNNL
jgi:hypothetical protein